LEIAIPAVPKRIPRVRRRDRAARNIKISYKGMDVSNNKPRNRHWSRKNNSPDIESEEDQSDQHDTMSNMVGDKGNMDWDVDVEGHPAGSLIEEEELAILSDRFNITMHHAREFVQIILAKKEEKEELATSHGNQPGLCAWEVCAYYTLSVLPFSFK
jgi:hypothetical protein